MPDTETIETITRFEVIDDYGRAFTLHDLKGVTISIQDDQRTLKVLREKIDK